MKGGYTMPEVNIDEPSITKERLLEVISRTQMEEWLTSMGRQLERAVAMGQINENDIKPLALRSPKAYEQAVKDAARKRHNP
jgi:hypothetical protein